MKNSKAVGPEKMHGTLLKLLKDDQLSIVFWPVFQLILCSGEIPTHWLKSMLIALPKKNNAVECGDYRTIHHTFL